MRIARTDLPFRKNCKQIFTEEDFEIVAILTVHPPKYSLNDAEKEEINGKFFEKELSLIANIMTKLDNDEFTVQLISAASIDLFPGHFLASFRNLCKEELALDGDWRVALSEIIPNEIKQCY